jgi:tetratricopeptide (TPR) repeat protein
MSNSRLEQLLHFYNDDPTDPFILYGLALEYQKIDIRKAEELFDKLVNEYMDYLPTYYQAANLKSQIGKTDEAISLYIKGIELAIHKKDTTTQRELQSALEELTF